jgi:hypothetical protein
MKLIDDWRRVVKKAWSSRLIVIAFVLTAVEVILPFFNEDIPRGLFAALSGLAVAGAFVARLVAQKEFNGDRTQ